MTLEERVNQIEQAVIKLNSVKMNITDLDNYRNIINTQLTDIRTAVSNILSRVEALETTVITYVNSLS